MELFDALGERIALEFSQVRDTVPRHLFYGPDAALRLAGALKRVAPGEKAVVLLDLRTKAATGGRCQEALARAGWTVEELLVPDGAGGASPVCDDVTKGELAARLPRADVLVAVGSGVVNDLAKWLAADASLPYAVYATAASMNGYAAANVAPTLGGVKSLFLARAPRLIAADPRVVEGAPFALTASGLGDVIAKPVSTADWLLNHRLFGEPFSRGVARIIDSIEPRYADRAADLARRDPGAVQALFEALVFSGCAMTLQGSSLPASGGEHLVSHTLDMLAHADGGRHDLHGRQVGLGTIVAAALYERVLALDRPRFAPTPAPFDPSVWGAVAPAVEAEHKKKCERMEEACRKLGEPGRWDSIKRDLTPLLRAPGAIKGCLARAGAAHRVADIGCTRERFLQAVLHCAAMRGRFTSVDLAWAAGVMPGAAQAIVDEWLLE